MSSVGNKNAKRIIRNRRDHHGSLLIFLLILAAAVFIVNTVTKDKSFSANENRSLAQRPKLTKEALTDGSFFSDYTTYYSDQFPLRDLWMSLSFRVNYLLNQREFSGVYVGKNGTLLQDPTTPDMNAVSSTTDAINRFAARYSDKDISALIVPGAATIWSDKLPANAPARNQNTDIAALESALDGSIRRIDAAGALEAHKGEDIYYRTDHHWTSLGAYSVFEACTDPLKLASEGIVYTPHVVSESFQGTLSSKSGDHRNYDTITVYEPQGTDVLYEVNYPDLQKRSTSLFVSEQLEEKDQYTVFFGGNHPLVEIRTTADNGRSLLIFKDSYANSFIQFLTPYYQTIVMVDPRYYYDDVSLAMNTYGVTDIMFLYSADTLLSDTALADVLNAAAAAGDDTEEMDMNGFSAMQNDGSDAAEGSEDSADTAGSGDTAEGSQAESGDASESGSDDSYDAGEGDDVSYDEEYDYTEDYSEEDYGGEDYSEEEYYSDGDYAYLSGTAGRYLYNDAVTDPEKHIFA